MGKYDDIINLQHPTSLRHPRMPMAERAAQFSPFAALTGHKDAIRETARLTEHRIELSEDEKMQLNEKLQIIEQTIGNDTVFHFTFFVPDAKKEGGAYIHHTGKVRKMDLVSGSILLEDHTVIDIDQLVKIEGDMVKEPGVR